MSDGNLLLRRARRQDVPAIVRLLASDPLGATREASGTGELPEAYWRAFEAIDAGPRQAARGYYRRGRRRCSPGRTPTWWPAA
jgi:hypothetical protein